MLPRGHRLGVICRGVGPWQTVEKRHHRFSTHGIGQGPGGAAGPGRRVPSDLWHNRHQVGVWTGRDRPDRRPGSTGWTR